MNRQISAGELSMKQRWKHYISVLLVLVAAFSLTGCQKLGRLIEQDLSKPTTQLTKPTLTGAQTKAQTQAQTSPGTKAVTTPQSTTPVLGAGLAAVPVKEDGRYTTKLEVAAYLYQFGKLPSNYLTKGEARDRGWVASKGNLWKVTKKMSIGGDRFGNNEGLLPKKSGRQYYECDIDYRGGSRGAKRIVYSNDGLIFYTGDHYETFEQLAGPAGGN